MVNFLRRTWSRYSKLGKRRKKKQVWRRPTGRDNKMREKKKGHPAVVSVGYKTKKGTRGELKEKTPTMVYNIKDLDKIGKNQIAVIGNVGKKKKIDLAKKAKESKIEIYNLNPKGFLKKTQPKKVKKIEDKKTPDKPKVEDKK